MHDKDRHFRAALDATLALFLNVKQGFIMNPCECCSCSITQGARTAAIISIVFNTIFMLHCFYSVLEVTSKHQVNSHEVHKIGTVDDPPAGTAENYFVGLPIAIRHDEVMITLGILILSSLRLALSGLFLLGVEKNRRSFVYPWILSTIVDLVGLFGLAIVLSQVIASFGADDGIFHELQIKTHDETTDEEDNVMLAFVLVVGIISLMITYCYFLWVGFAFVSAARNNALRTAASSLSSDGSRSDTNSSNRTTNRPRRFNRVGPPSQFQPSGDGLPFYGDAYIHTFEPTTPECAPPTYEVAVKMPRPSWLHDSSVRQGEPK